MPSYRDNRYARRYGILAGPAVVAPMFVVAMVGCVIGLLVMVPTAMFASRTTVAQGNPGETIALAWQGKDPGSLVIVSNTPAAQDAATCQLHQADGSVDPRGIGWTAPKPLHLDGATWHTVTRLSFPKSGESFICTGSGLGELRAVHDRSVEFWVIVGILAFGLLGSIGMTALGFSMRRAVDRQT